MRQGLLSSCLIAATLLAGAAAHAQPTAAEKHFTQAVLPILKQHCYQCHSHDANKAKGGLVLDSRSGWAKGGDSGPAIVPGKPNESLLIKAVRHNGLEMPPTGKLPAELIATLERWVQDGAVDPRTATPGQVQSVVDLARGRKHWAFQPLRSAAPPEVKDTAWPNGAIDRFLLAALEKEGLHPADDAERAVWLRRVSFDLTGLPPTPEEMAAFARDRSPLAFAQVVERLLASRAFGERWARHWLDLVGYADQTGTANNVFAQHAWRYRDYLIRAFNEDRPFDQFVREQIAGDLLPYRSARERSDQLTATGFLVLGNIDIVEADLLKLRVDVVDQQLEKVGKVFLGQTLNCARCHDHKFDPISAHDYYALAGIFHSSESVYFTRRGVWSDVVAAELPETPAQLQAREAAAQVHAARLAQLRAELAAAQQDKGAAAKLPTLKNQLQHAAFFAPAKPLAYTVRDRAAPADMRLTIRGNPRALGESVPRGFLSVLAHRLHGPAIPSGQSGRLQLAEWLVHPDNPLTARVTVNRLWQKLFGEGLVRSVDYFGVRGDEPSHPELLDHLARRLQHGWSQKQLIRAIVLSRAYRQANVGEPRAHAIDPANRLLSRMSALRLDAEALRDALLATSGQLRACDGGPALPLEYVENVGNLAPASVNPPSFQLSKFRPEQTFQRTIYLPVVRSMPQPGPADIRNYFDFPQPAQFVGKRNSTSTPTQALFLLNSELVKTSAAALAQEVLASKVSSDERLAQLWLRVLNRALTPAERVDARAFLREAGGEEARGWTLLIQSLYLSSDFLMRS